MLRLAITIGAAGAVASFRGTGASAVARTGAGTYEITLDRAWPSVHGLHGAVQRASGAVLTPRKKAAYDPATHGRKLAFEVVVAAGTATDPSSGDVVEVNAVLIDHAR